MINGLNFQTEISSLSCLSMILILCTWSIKLPDNYPQSKTTLRLIHTVFALKIQNLV